jgi:succinate dehydrogenase / fumarate reductase, cytochrome b subunit
MEDTRDALMIGRNSDGKLVRRPVSPHLQIYRWPVTMLSSILNRATGIALSVGCLLLVWWLVAAAGSANYFNFVQGFLGSWLGVLMLLGWVAALSYHVLNGIRHMVWDTARGLEQAGLNGGSYLVLGGTAALTLLVWVIGFAAWR